jgi:hypothetical protein
LDYLLENLIVFNFLKAEKASSSTRYGIKKH